MSVENKTFKNIIEALIVVGDNKNPNAHLLQCQTTVVIEDGGVNDKNIPIKVAKENQLPCPYSSAERICRYGVSHKPGGVGLVEVEGLVHCPLRFALGRSDSVLTLVLPEPVAVQT